MLGLGEPEIDFTSSSTNPYAAAASTAAVSDVSSNLDPLLDIFGPAVTNGTVTNGNLPSLPGGLHPKAEEVFKRSAMK